MNEKIEKILAKYFMNNSNIDDLEVLSEWLKKKDNKKIFRSYVKTNYAMDMNINEFNTANAKKDYLEKIRKDNQKVRRLNIQRITKYAAAAVVLIGLATFYLLKDSIFFETQFKESPVEIVDTNIDQGTDKATLILESGETVILEKGSRFQNSFASSNGENISYQNKSSKKLVYNYLAIPRGGQYQLTLADGTQVWLNSESKLKYPVNFVDGKDRKVELIYGEAYFDVSPSTNHNGSRFIVLNKSQEIEVLGTEFNVKAYEDDDFVYTTLVEGVVNVKLENATQNLKPNQKLSLDLKSGSMMVSNVDVFNEISWKDGIFSFEEESLENIMKVLSRWYDVEVIFENDNIKSEEFIGLLRKDQSLNKIVQTIKDFGIIKNYEFNGKQLILK